MPAYRIFRRVAPLILGAFGCLAVSLPACAQAPATVTPVPREGLWMTLHKQFLEEARKGDVGLLFLGDSITQGWSNNEVWRRHYVPRHAANFGIGGDRTEHVLWRIRHGEIDGIRPGVVVLMIGTNNVGNNAPDDIVLGIETIVKELRTRLPDSHVLLLGVFPRSQKPDIAREVISSINRRIARLGDGSKVTFLDISGSFLNSDGTISREVMPDYLHLSARGYRYWAEAMEPTLWRILDEAKVKK